MQVDRESNVFVYSLKPILESYDSSEECSLDHWIEVSRLVDELDDTAVPSKTVVAVAASEVKSPATYQHFAGNVVR